MPSPPATSRTRPGPARVPAGVALVRRWLRGSRRRPGRALAIVASLAVMSLSTVGALVAGDALERLFVLDAEAEWGPVDLAVRADDDAVHELSTGRLLAVEGAPAVVAAAPRLVLQSVATAGGRTEPLAGLLGLGAEEQSFPPLEPRDGQHDPLRLGPDEVILNARLAGRLGVGVGDAVRFVAAVPRWEEEVATSSTPIVHPPFPLTLDLQVAGIVADAGTADLNRVPNALVRRDVLARAAGMDGRVTVTHLRTADPGRDGARRAIDALAPVTLVRGLDVDAVKVDQLDLAEEEGGLFRSILLTLALIVIGAAVVATHALLVALADERARELAVLRAMGCRRRTAIGLLTAEAAGLGVVGAAVGAVAGVPFGRLLASLLADHLASLSSGRGREQVALPEDVGVAAVLLGAGIVAAIAVAAGRSAAATVVDSPLAEVLRGGALGIRPRPPSRRRVAVTALLGAFLLGVGTGGGGPLLFLGATTSLAGWWLARRREPPDRTRVDRRAAAAGLVWAVLGGAALADPAGGVQAGAGTLVVAGASAILCTAVLAVPRLPATMRLLRGLVPLGWPQVALRTAATQAVAAPRRSATTITVLGGVLFMVAALSVLGSTTAAPLERQAGGFDVLARSVARLDAQAMAAVPGVAAVAAVPDAILPETAYAVQDATGRSATVPYPVRVMAPTTAMVSAQRFGLAAAVPEVGSAGEALSVLLAQRGSAVVDRAALPEGARVGDDVVIDVGVAPRRLRLLAVLDTWLLGAVLLNEADMASVAELRGPTAALLRAAPGTDPDVVAAAVQAAGRADGVTAETMAQRREDAIAVNRTFTDTFSLMLVLGLAVATASVAATVVRAARERRAELSVLRATGLPRAGVALLLAAEPALTALVGVVAGAVVGIGLLRVHFAVAFPDLPFVVAWDRVAGIGVATVLLLATVCLASAAVAAPRDVGAGLRDLG